MKDSLMMKCGFSILFVAAIVLLAIAWFAEVIIAPIHKFYVKIQMLAC